MFTRPGVHGFSHGIVSNDSRMGFSDAPVSNVSGMLGATLDNSLAIATWKLCGACLDIGTPQKKKEKRFFSIQTCFFHKKEIILPIDSIIFQRGRLKPPTRNRSVISPRFEGTDLLGFCRSFGCCCGHIWPYECEILHGFIWISRCQGSINQ